jgi:hypothetical protein
MLTYAGVDNSPILKLPQDPWFLKILARAIDKRADRCIRERSSDNEWGEGPR